jgi:hypothetical protein
MSRSTICWLGISSKYFTKARRLLPWAVTNTCFPDQMLGTISSRQHGRNHCVFEALGQGKLSFWEVSIAWILPRIAWVRLVQGPRDGRRNSGARVSPVAPRTLQPSQPC